MVVGFVNSGFMTLMQAIGVIMGANIGTTITGWILVFAIGKYGLPMLGISALVYKFSRSDKTKHIAMAIMGIGMVFFGLELMKDGFKPIRSMPDFLEWFAAFRAEDYLGVMKCAFIGCILTCIVQSSSATLGITIGLASTGVINFESAAALVLGENIGTTITAFLASLGSTTNAKRAAYAHVIFNIIGVLWVTSLFHVCYMDIIKGILPNDPHFSVIDAEGNKNFIYITAGIATVHSVFNITNTLLFLPFIQHLARFLEQIVPNKPFKEAPHITQLDSRVMETPVIGIEQARVEILRMGENVTKMLDKQENIMTHDVPDDKLIKKIFHREEVLDIMQKEVTIFLTEILSDNESHEIADEARIQLRIADEMESIGDYIANLLKLRLRLEKANLKFHDKEKTGLHELHKLVTSYVHMIINAYEERHADIISKANSQGDAITFKARELRSMHLNHVSEEKMVPLTSIIFSDSLNSYRKIKDHTLNTAEAIAGEK
jgi:phosphate:Na+ symporter